MKPMTIILIGAIIVVIGGFVGAIGTFVHNKKSSAKTDRIEIGIKQTDLSVSNLKAQNDSLSVKLEKQSETIEKLREENTDLSIRLSDKTSNIYDISKAIKFPLPPEVEISYKLRFELQEPMREKAHNIINSNSQLNENCYTGINPTQIIDLLDWNVTNEWLCIFFLKDYKKGTSSSVIAEFTNYKYFTRSSWINSLSVLYNPTSKDFLMEVENKILYFEPGLKDNIKANLIATSIQDLSNTTMQFSQPLTRTIQDVSIQNFKIRSKELNLYFWELVPTGQDGNFIGEVKSEHF